MNNKIALLIIYNHRFDKNIPRLDELYAGKFSHVYHIVPFYDGQKDNVLAVYDNSFYFESYIAQAYQKIKDKGFSHFFFVADDMILNPAINENNLFDFTGISSDSSWIKDLRDYKTHPHYVPMFTPIKQNGIEVSKFLPSCEDVCKILDKNNLSYFPSKLYGIGDFFHRIKQRALKSAINAIKYVFSGIKNKSYPAIWGYSDVLLIPSAYMEKFALYCGAFGGLNVFVENATPLALLLASDKILTEKDIKLKVVSQLYGLGRDGQKEFEDKYAYSLQKLLSDYPKDWLLCHPIKLSKWK